MQAKQVILVGMMTTENHVLGTGPTNFQKLQELPQDSRSHQGNMKQVPIGTTIENLVAWDLFTPVLGYVLANI
jgi:hypothetical protein